MGVGDVLTDSVRMSSCPDGPALAWLAGGEDFFRYD